MDTRECTLPRDGPVTRPHWTAGSYLTAGACGTEQNYRLQRFRRHNRELHGWGVVCGLWVVPGNDGPHPWLVKVCPGYALGPYGDEIELPQPAPVDVTDYLWFRPPRSVGGVVLPDIAYVVVRYQAWLDDLNVVPGGACECKEPVYRESRTGDGYQAGVIWTLPADSKSPGICDRESPPCPPCPDSPWVVLAKIVLPQTGVAIATAMIDNGIRATL
jgi:hypothetical protein